MTSHHNHHSWIMLRPEPPRPSRIMLPFLMGVTPGAVAVLLLIMVVVDR